MGHQSERIVADIPRHFKRLKILMQEPWPAEFLTLGTGFSYGSLRNRGLYVAQQTCSPGLEKENSYQSKGYS